MAQETFVTEDGRKRTVIAPDEADLKDAVAEVKAQSDIPAFDINVPVQKGHDLLPQIPGSDVAAVDGTGAHNSPLPAVDEDTGEVRGSDPLLVRPSVVPAVSELKEFVAPGKLKDANEADVEVEGSATANKELEDAAPKE